MTADMAAVAIEMELQDRKETWIASAVRLYSQTEELEVCHSAGPEVSKAYKQGLLEGMIQMVEASGIPRHEFFHAVVAAKDKRKET